MKKGKNWTAMLPNKQKNYFYNPIKQNKTHLKWMRKYVGEDVPLFSIIVFSERCELKKITVESEDVKVIKRDRVYATVRDIWEVNWFLGLLRVEHMPGNSFMDVVHFLNADILKMPNGIGASYEIIYRNTI